MTKIIKMHQTRVTTTNRVMPRELNRNHTLFGGHILALIDQTSSIAVNLVTKEPIATVALDSVNFIAPLQQDEIYTLTCYASGIAASSIEVFFKIKGRAPTEDRETIRVNGFITFALLNHHDVSAQLEAFTQEEIYILEHFPQRLKQRHHKLQQLKEMQKLMD